MELQAEQFYIKAAGQAEDVGVRRLLGDLAEAEKAHENLAARLTDKILSPDVRAEEDKTRRRMFVLQYVQPGLAGLMDGSVSTLAPLFAAAFATHQNWPTFLVGLAASIGAGISMGFAEALSDDGSLTGSNPRRDLALVKANRARRPKADIPPALTNVRFRGGKADMTRTWSMSANDPKRTWDKTVRKPEPSGRPSLGRPSGNTKFASTD